MFSVRNVGKTLVTRTQGTKVWPDVELLGGARSGMGHGSTSTLRSSIAWHAMHAPGAVS
jgi:hypothetical protein